MIRNTDKRHAGDVPARADGTAETAAGAFDSCRAEALLLTRRSLETVPSKSRIMKINVGDIFLIPFQNKYIIGKILWVSKRTRNVFSFILYKKTYSIKEIDFEQIDETIEKIKLYEGLEEVFFTSKKIFEDKNWEIIGNKILNDNESTNLQYHNTGGNLCKGDEYIRALTEDEIKTRKYSRMLIAGYEAIYIYLEIMYKDNIKIKL